jgi:hypothetical protein
MARHKAVISGSVAWNRPYLPQTAADWVQVLR